MMKYLFLFCFLFSCQNLFKRNYSLIKGEIISIKLKDEDVIIQANFIKQTKDDIFLDIKNDVIKIKKHRIVSLKKTLKEFKIPLYKDNKLYDFNDINSEFDVKLLERTAVKVLVPGISLGSGFFISKEGYVLTNYHVINNVKKDLEVYAMITGKNIKKKHKFKNVKIISIDPFRDLALLKVDLKGYKITFAKFSKEDVMQNGDIVFAIGNPKGFEWTTTKGIVSSKYRLMKGVRFIQVDTPINSGNSGGPLFNIHGEIVGMIDAKIPNADGLGFCIPREDILYFLNYYTLYKPTKVAGKISNVFYMLP